jgi:hypothetical protein
MNRFRGVATGLAALVAVASGLATYGVSRVDAVEAPPPLPAGANVHVVPLITGDRIAVIPQADGTVEPKIVPGSPHQRGESVRFATPAGSFLIPQLPVVERAKLDTSLFNLTSLAALRSARVPVELTFAPGAAPHRIPGLSLELKNTVHLKSSVTPVEASYGRRFAGLRPQDLAHVVRIARPMRRETARPTGLPQNTLTIHLSTAGGKPADGVGYLIDLDNSRRYFETPDIQNGLLKIQVPQDHYCVIVWTFTGKLVIDSEFPVTQDHAISLNLGDATVKPTVDVPSFAAVDTIISVGRLPEKGFAFPLTFEFDGVPARMRLQPAWGNVTLGRLASGISATLAPQGEQHQQVPSTLAVTGDSHSGIPTTLQFTHPRSDFAVVQQRFHANGPAGLRMTGLSAAARDVNFFTIGEYPVHVPGLRTVLLQASPHVAYDQKFYPVQTLQNENFSLEIDRFSRYPDAGPAPAVPFLHGPVGPGIEAGYRTAAWGRYCLLCRVGNELNGSLPLIDGAGSDMYGYIGKADGSWSLWHDGSRIRTGSGQIAPHLALPAGRASYTLTATLHPAAPIWTLSKQVKDAWTFTSGYSHAVVPILIARYLPKIALDGSMSPGPTGFRLDFANLGKTDDRVVRASVSVSNNGGRTWRPVHLSRLDENSFHVEYTNPASHGTVRYMSLLVTGVDSDGHLVRETALRVYRLRP